MQSSLIGRKLCYNIRDNISQEFKKIYVQAERMGCAINVSHSLYSLFNGVLSNASFQFQPVSSPTYYGEY